MKVQEIAGYRDLMPQKPSGRETPHVTIEPNTTCNIKCTACYNVEKPLVKSLAVVRAEIDLACRKRNLDAISLLGGEPTLHPDIVEIVRYVKEQGKVCMLLTNGVRFLRDDGQRLLDALIAAGVDRFLVHMDSGQAHVHGDIDATRHRLFDLLDARRVYYGLSLTLYAGEERELPLTMKRFAQHPYFDGVLVTLAMDFEHALDASEGEVAEPDMAAVYRAVTDELGIEPSAYLPTSLDDSEVAWLMYFYYLNAETGRAFGLSPRFNQSFKQLYRRLRGHEFFAETMDRRWMPASLALTAGAELVLAPQRVGSVWRLLRRAAGTRGLRFHYIVVQQAPRWNASAEDVQICWQCPDATIRDGKLTPVCIASRLAPLDGSAASVSSEVMDSVWRHLDQVPAE